MNIFEYLRQTRYLTGTEIAVAALMAFLMEINRIGYTHNQAMTEHERRLRWLYTNAPAVRNYFRTVVLSDGSQLMAPENKGYVNEITAQIESGDGCRLEGELQEICLRGERKYWRIDELWSPKDWAELQRLTR